MDLNTCVDGSGCCDTVVAVAVAVGLRTSVAVEPVDRSVTILRTLLASVLAWQLL